MRRILLIATTTALLTAVVFGSGCSKETAEPEAAAVPPRMLDPERLLSLSANRDHPLRLRDDRDTLPGGLAASAAPMLIDWEASEIGRPDGFVVVRNLNYGGNPLEGTTVLQRVKIPLDGVERIEWVLVPLSGGGKRGKLHHGQLRFVFRADRPLELLDLMGPEAGGDRELRDLVASWDAWREPGVAYNVKVGLDPAAYSLGLHLYGGPQRFLRDAIDDHGWYCTTLRLPGGAEGLAEVLKVTLALGDGVARQTLSRQFAAAEAEWLAATPAEKPAEVAAAWRRLAQKAAPKPVTDDARLNLPPEQQTYQTILRSCATIAHYCVLVAVERLHERGLNDGVVRSKLDPLHLGGDEPWMREVAHAGLGGILSQAPTALRWLREHPQAIPSEIPLRLDEAGLVLRQDGAAREIHYSATGRNPYRP